MISTNGIVPTSGESKYLTYGIQSAMITGGDIRKSPNGYITVTLNMESPEVTAAGFEPDAEAKRGGKIGHVEFAGYIDENQKDNPAMAEFLSRVSLVAQKLGVVDEVNLIQAPSVEQYIDRLIPILRGKFAWWAITGREYAKKNSDKIGIALGLRRYGFIASDEEGKDHLRAFEKTNKYDYKAEAVPSNDPVSNDNTEENTIAPAEWDF